jgi:hypothetical protein
VKQMYTRQEVEKSLEREPLSDVLYKIERFARANGSEALATWCANELRGYHGSDTEEYRSVSVQWQDGFGRPLILNDPKFHFILTVPMWSGVSEIESYAENGTNWSYPDAAIMIREMLRVPVTVAWISPDQMKSLLKRIRLEARTRLHDAFPRTPNLMAKSDFRSPWITGSFYLAALVVIGTLFLVMARTVNGFVLPIVMLASLFAVSLIGAFQLRNDDKLSQKNFLELMILTFKYLPLLGKKESTNQKALPDKDLSESSSEVKR